MNSDNLAVNSASELGNLCAQTIKAVIGAQETMDAYTLQQKQAYDNAAEGELVIPPTWYHFSRVALEMELSAQVSYLEDGAPHIVCRTLNPNMVSLYGYAASSGMRIAVQIEPSGMVPIKQTSTNEVAVDHD